MTPKILGPKVLLIEKNKHLTRILEACIFIHGMHLSRMGSLEGEVSNILSHRYSLLVVDTNLALDSNAFAIRMIKEHNVMLPIIAIGPNNQSLEIRAYQLGINIYHSKPIRCELLKAQVTQLTSYYYKKVMLLENIEIDISSQSFYVHDRKINFTYQEFHLLLLLIRAEGSVLNRNNISKYSFSSHKDISYAAIDTLISRIRAKLNKHFEKPFIKTEYKLGYRINPIYLRTYQDKTNQN